jgi:hypothetical protein
VTSHGDSVGNGILGFVFTLTFGTPKTAELSNLRAVRKEIPWYSFLSKADWTSGVSKADGRISHLKFFKDTTGNRTWDLPSCRAVSEPPALLATSVFMQTVKFSWYYIGHYFIWQLSVATSCWLAYRVNVVYLSEGLHARRTNGWN